MEITMLNLLVILILFFGVGIAFGYSVAVAHHQKGQSKFPEFR